MCYRQLELLRRTLTLSKKNELVQRVIAAFFGALIIISSILIGKWTFFAVFLFIALITQWEFYRLVRSQSFIPMRVLGVSVGAVLFAMTFLIEAEILPFKYYFVLLPFSALIYFFKLYKKNEESPFINIAFFFLGIIYCALPFSLLNVAAFASKSGEYSYQIIIGILMILWCSDTGAYFAGVRFGKTKLFERVSPKKSWEGSIGGSVFALTAASIFAYYFEDLEVWQWITVAIIIIVAGTYGDLVESMFKRSIHIKDSGHSIPGHGGFLDRFDGLLLSMPFIVVFLELF